MRFEILSGDGETLHAQGKAVRGRTPEGGRQDLSAVRARCTETESPDAIYRRCVEAGLNLGEAFRTIRSVWFTENEALARLELPAALSSAAQEFTLHPGLMDGALQATAVLCRAEAAGLPVPFAVTEVRFNRLEPNCYAHVRRRSEENGLLRFDISLLDDSGEVLAELKGLAMRALRPKATADEQEVIFVRPTWEEKPLLSGKCRPTCGTFAVAGHRGIAGQRNQPAVTRPGNPARCSGREFFRARESYWRSAGSPGRF